MYPTSTARRSGRQGHRDDLRPVQGGGLDQRAVAGQVERAGQPQGVDGFVAVRQRDPDPHLRVDPPAGQLPPPDLVPFADRGEPARRPGLRVVVVVAPLVPQHVEGEAVELRVRVAELQIGGVRGRQAAGRRRDHPRLDQAVEHLDQALVDQPRLHQLDGQRRHSVLDEVAGVRLADHDHVVQVVGGDRTPQVGGQHRVDLHREDPGGPGPGRQQRQDAGARAGVQHHVARTDRRRDGRGEGLRPLAVTQAGVREVGRRPQRCHTGPPSDSRARPGYVRRAELRPSSTPPDAGHRYRWSGISRPAPPAAERRRGRRRWAPSGRRRCPSDRTGPCRYPSCPAGEVAQKGQDDGGEPADVGVLALEPELVQLLDHVCSSGGWCVLEHASSTSSLRPDGDIRMCSARYFADVTPRPPSASGEREARRDRVAARGGY